MMRKILTALPSIILIIFGGILFLINLVFKNWEIEKLVNKISNLIFKMDEWSDK